MEGISLYYFSFFSDKTYFASEKNKHLEELGSWHHTDSSFNDYFINIFSKNSVIKSIPTSFLDVKDFNYNDELSSCVFSIETKLKNKEYKYLNIIKCGFSFKYNSIDEFQNISKTKSDLLYQKIVELNIPEFSSKTDYIKKQLFLQKLKTQIVLIGDFNCSFNERKYMLLDIALDKPAGTAKNTFENEFALKMAHSKSFLEILLNKSLIDQYQDWSSIITHKKIVSIYDSDYESINNIFFNNSIQYGLIYIQKIIVSELITCLNLWINENKFENNLELSKNYFHISRNFDFTTISTKHLYNEYSRYLDENLKINNEKEIINNKLKEIENILEKENNRLTNILLFIVAILQLISVFIDKITFDLATKLQIAETRVNYYMFILFTAICAVIIVILMKKRKI